MSTSKKWSTSELNAFRDCPRKWLTLYHHGLTPKIERESEVRVFGVVFHEAVALFYGADIPNYELPEDIADEVATTLAAYTRKYPPEERENFEEFSILEVEAAHEKVTPAGHIVRGKIDRLTEDDQEQLYVVDVKTSKSAASRIFSWAHMSAQFLTYCWLTGAQHVLIDYVGRFKVPRFEREVFFFPQERIDNHVRDIDQTIEDAIRTAETQTIRTARTHRTPDCSWKCPLFNICPLLDMDDAEQVVQEQLRPHNPNERYDEDTATR